MNVLMTATYSGHLHIINYLLSIGADPGTADRVSLLHPRLSVLLIPSYSSSGQLLSCLQATMAMLML
jgi:ankyrin repeat protein